MEKVKCDKGAPESQTLIVLSPDPETIDDPSGENATERIQLLCAFVFSVLSSSVAAREGRRRQFWPRKGDFFGAAVTPEFQTLIVLSTEQETIDDPSGEKATDKISRLCALAFSVLRSSVAAKEGKRHQFWPREAIWRSGPT